MEDFAVNLVRTLAADIRFTTVDLKNDQVWEFTGSGGEPPALALQTTYGLRCRGIKIFPRFSSNGTTLTDPRTFSKPPRIIKRLPDYLLVTCSPFSSLDVELEYWVPCSTSICGRTKITNTGKGSITVNCDWAVLLQPLQKGEAMASAEMGINKVLRGTAEDLHPVFFLTGGPQVSSKAYPALSLEMTLAAGAERRVSWSLASLDSHEASFTLARQNTALQWENEILRREMEEKSKLFHFVSDDPQIDHLLHESQIKARQCVIQGLAPERKLTLLDRRVPDLPLGNNSTSSKKKQAVLLPSAYDLWHASRILLPFAPELFKESILSYIETQQADGGIPWAVSANGIATSALLPPLLAGIARDVHPYLLDTTWLAQVFAPLIEAFKNWFNSGWPVWDHLMQTGLDTAPLYSRWLKENQGVDLQYIDSPALGAMLYNECLALMQINQWLGKNESFDWLQTKAEEIKTHVLASWNEEKGTFQYRDILNGEIFPSSNLRSFKSDGVFNPRLNCRGERRLLIRCLKPQGFPEITRVTLAGKNSKGKIEETFRFTPGQFQEGIARITSQQIFTNIVTVEIAGLKKGDSVVIALAGFDDEDISLALPLWAGLLSPEQARRFTEKTLFPRYLSKFGLSALPNDRYPDQPHAVFPFWNAIITEGLLHYGLREEAASVTRAFFTGAKTQWETNGKMNDAINVLNAQGIGNRDSLSGLPTILPFLRTLGMEFPLKNEIIFNGLNDYFSAFTVQYGRASVSLNRESTTITMLNGSKTVIHETGMQKSILP